MPRPKARNKRNDCVFCTKSFCNSTEYYKHANRLHNDLVIGNWFCCSTCFTYFPSQATLTNHQNQGHQQKSTTVGDRVPCNYCESTFYNHHVYYKHVNSKHRDVIIDEWFFCKTCRQYFPSQTTLQKHRDQAHSTKRASTSDLKRISCQFCNNSYLNFTTYYKHANNDHPDEVVDEWHGCAFCSQFFPTLLTLKKHKEQSHTQRTLTGQVACKYCPSVFSKPQIYYKHANRMHQELILDDGWFSCDHCGVMFPSQLGLSMHSTIHRLAKVPATAAAAAVMAAATAPARKSIQIQKKKKINCNFCSNTYCDTTQYYRHANREHLDHLLLEDWYRCDVCLSYFPNESVLGLHQMHAHNMKQNSRSDNWSPQPEEKDDHEFVAVDCVLIEDDEEVETPSTSSDFSPKIENYFHQENADEDYESFDRDDGSGFDPDLLCPNVEILEEEEEDPLAV